MFDIKKCMKISTAGKLIYYFLPYRRKLIQENIDQVFKDTLSKEEKKLLIQAFYSHLATSLKEMLLLRFISAQKLASQVEVRGYEYLLDVAKNNKGVLVLTGHFGNWEYAPLGGMANFKEFKGRIHFIRKTLKPLWLEKIIFRRYYKAGLNIIPKKNSLNKACDVLEKNDAVIFVLDQHAMLETKDGIAVPFFGKNAGTYRSLASIAGYTGVPVIPAAGYRTQDNKHVLEFYEPIYWHEYSSHKESLYQNTLLYNRALEKIILAHPEQWLWLHRRWKLKH